MAGGKGRQPQIDAENVAGVAKIEVLLRLTGASRQYSEISHDCTGLARQ